MNCQKFESIVSELARDQMMEAELRVDALSHSNECSPCATHLRSEEMLTSNLYGLAAETELLQAPDRVERHLVQAFRERKGLEPQAKVTHRARYWLGAVAAVLLVFAV